MAKTLFAAAVATVLGLSSALPVAKPAFEVTSDKIHPEVAKYFESHEKGEFFVKIANSLDARTIIPKYRFNTREERISTVVREMTKHTNEVQAGVVGLLANARSDVAFEQFWITNSIYVNAADRELLMQLASRPDVEMIYPNEEVPLHHPVEAIHDTEPSVNAVEWGISKIKADKLWALGYNGQGVVVANIDTGVRTTHESLRSNYRGNVNGVVNHDYSFFDRQWNSPQDYNGHGTHTMGTIAGTNGIGVAPGSKWIAAVGCRAASCSTLDLTASAQWLVCPTRWGGSGADCSKAPHVINNSWGGGQASDWYYSYVQAWLAADIIPVFSQGNSGPNCGTANSPGDYNNVIGVGATDINDGIASFSSRGPARSATFTGSLKPDISAPGASIRSAYPTSDTSYSTLSGTSMAGPHVAGSVALLLSANQNLAYQNVYDLFATSASTALLADKTCGGVSSTTFPNFTYGYGRLDVCKAATKTGKVNCA